MNKIITRLGVLFLFVLFCQEIAFSQNSYQLTARQVVDLVKKHITCAWMQKTVDTFKTGNPDDVVTGIAVCMFPDFSTLEKAVAQKCNLIIVHEPTFYNHLDDTDFLTNDEVYKKKAAYINTHKLIIFRFHDHWHMTVPDGIEKGIVERLGWKSNQIDSSQVFFKLKEQTVSDLAETLKKKLKINKVRVVGNPEMRFTNVALAVGASGFGAHREALSREFTQVLVAGEASEWETYEYVLDASKMGFQKAAIITGHIPSEDAGMEYCARWLKSFVLRVPVVYFENGMAYSYF
jgi:putative NIF3 family GTP cyclohydrolase 1 type 2